MKKTMLLLLLITTQSASAGIPGPDLLLLSERLCSNLPTICFQEEKGEAEKTATTAETAKQTNNDPSKEDK